MTIGGLPWCRTAPAAAIKGRISFRSPVFEIASVTVLDENKTTHKLHLEVPR